MSQGGSMGGVEDIRLGDEPHLRHADGGNARRTIIRGVVTVISVIVNDIISDLEL